MIFSLWSHVWHTFGMTCWLSLTTSVPTCLDIAGTRCVPWLYQTQRWGWLLINSQESNYHLFINWCDVSLFLVTEWHTVNLILFFSCLKSWIECFKVLIKLWPRQSSLNNILSLWTASPKTSACHTRRLNILSLFNKEGKGRESLEERLKLDADKWENAQEVRRPQGTDKLHNHVTVMWKYLAKERKDALVAHITTEYETEWQGLLYIFKYLNKNTWHGISLSLRTILEPIAHLYKRLKTLQLCYCQATACSTEQKSLPQVILGGRPPNSP